MDYKATVAAFLRCMVSSERKRAWKKIDLNDIRGIESGRALGLLQKQERCDRRRGPDWISGTAKLGEGRSCRDG